MDEELLQQFLLECRELVATGNDDLLALERNSGDRARTDSAFRAFHTLKGAAGIIGFEPMATALHAAEDALAAVRGGTVLTRPLVDACLACLDHVGRWLDAIEATGGPPADAAPEAKAIVARFRPALEERTPALPEPARDDWLAELLDRHHDLLGRATTAVRYQPDQNCFFRGEDPLAIADALPGILSLDLVPTAAWPALTDLDPFRCAIELHLLGSLPVEETIRFLGGLRRGAVTVVAVPVTIPLAPAAAAFLKAQLATLADRAPVGLPGRLRAAARVASNVLRRARREADVGAIETALGAAIATGSPDPLAEAIALLLGRTGAGPVSIAPAPPVPEHPVEAVTAPAPVRSLRVDVDRIETLVKLVGELVVLKNAIGYSAELALTHPASLGGRLKDQHATLERLSGELRSAVLGVRVLPFRSVFQRFPRLVRDLGVALGRPIELTTAGDDTEADKAVVEALFEPLLHLVRNAADHGIEPPAVRAARGKPAAGQIRIVAGRDGENVVIEVSDDGAGMDAERIRAVAAERGIADVESLPRMADEAVLDLVFAPGFSTAATVTDVSGRGVGMDVVRATIERLGGRVAIRSTLGSGTTVTLRLPVSALIRRLMTVDIGGQSFGIPLDAVIETALVPRERISRIGGAEAFILRSRTIPLIDLRAALGNHGSATPQARVVVVSVSGGVGALEVDALGDRFDTIVSPMSGLLDGAPSIAGTALLGDGRVLIVIDVEELLA